MTESFDLETKPNPHAETSEQFPDPMPEPVLELPEELPAHAEGATDLIDLIDPVDTPVPENSAAEASFAEPAAVTEHEILPFDSKLDTDSTPELYPNPESTSDLNLTPDLISDMGEAAAEPETPQLEADTECQAGPEITPEISPVMETCATIEIEEQAAEPAEFQPEDNPPFPIEEIAEAVAETPVAAAPEFLPTALKLHLAAHTDIGCVRTNNEDSFGYDQSLGLYIVCDGMGGMASGEIASALAVSTVMSTFAASAEAGLPVSTRLSEAITAANSAVWAYGQQPEHRGMGTTLVAAAVDGPSLIIGNVGDSRAYMLHNGQCMQLTVDHSYLNELIRNGTLTLENAHRADLNGMESVITRAIGAAPEVQPDFFSIFPSEGDLFLLVSDGLTRYLGQDEILEVLFSTDLQNAPHTLIEIAKQRGGVDNITCLVLQTSEAAS